MPPRQALALAPALLMVLTAAGMVLPWAADPPAGDDAEPIGRTPPRLAFVDGQVSFWRPGADDWVAARVNTALAPGDELYTGAPGNVELQVGPRAWVRAWGRTQLGLAGLEPDFAQFKITTGYVSLDLRRLDPGHTVEVDTPNAAFTIEHPGYYRLTVAEGRTSFIARRGGRAIVTPATGTAATIAPSEEAVVEGTDAARVSTFVAPELDVWDRWNYARTDALLDSLSSRYVAAGVYGIDDLDQHGSWRVVATYGAVWVPTGLPAGWVPYSTGSWTWDPFYGWTWVDLAPWGWAPYHHGRWVLVGGFWAWAPGPLVARPVYAPALVAFFGPRPGLSVGGPVIGWVALGWGEPIIPWWGPVGFIGAPRWLGWGGPRIVNDVVISHTTVVHAHDVRAYRNARELHGITAVPRDRFGHGPVHRTRVTPDAAHLEPIRGRPDAPAARASLVPDPAGGVRPPEGTLRRPVVATRPPEDPARPLAPHGIPTPARTPPALVPPPRRASDAPAAPRPPFGTSTIERRRSAPPPSPGRTPPPSPGARPSVGQPAPARPSSTPSPTPAPRVRAAPQSSALPGEPANRLSPGRSPEGLGRVVAPPAGRAPGEPSPAPREHPRPAAPGR